jgi:hypothetical protein
VCIIIKKNNVIFVTGIAINRRHPNIKVQKLKREKCLMSGRPEGESNMFTNLAGVARMES